MTPPWPLYIFFSTCLALRLPRLSPNAIYQNMIFMEHIGRMLHCVDLILSSKDLLYILKLPTLPFQAIYDNTCPQNMDIERFKQISDRYKYDTKVILVLASPGCLASVPDIASDFNYQMNYPSSILLSQDQIPEIPKYQISLELNRVLSFRHAAFDTCNWMAYSVGAWDLEDGESVLRLWDRLHPRCFEQSMQSSVLFYMVRALITIYDQHASNYGPMEMARQGLKLANMFMICKGLPKPSTRSAAFKMLQILLEALKRHNTRLTQRLKCEWIFDYMAMMSYILDQKEIPKDFEFPTESLLNAINGDRENDAVAMHFQMQLFELKFRMTGEVSKLPEGIYSEKSWPLDWQTALLMEKEISRTPSDSVTKHLRDNKPNGLQNIVIEQAYGQRLQKLPLFDSILLTCIPLRLRLGYFRRRQGLFSVGRHRHASSYSASKMLRKQLVVEEIAIFSIKKMIRRNFSKFTKSGVIDKNGAVRLGSSRKMMDLSMSLVFCLMFGIPFPHRIHLSAFELITGYAPVTVQEKNGHYCLYDLEEPLKTISNSYVAQNAGESMQLVFTIVTNNFLPFGISELLDLMF